MITRANIARKRFKFRNTRWSKIPLLRWPSYRGAGWRQTFRWRCTSADNSAGDAGLVTRETARLKPRRRTVLSSLQTGVHCGSGHRPNRTSMIVRAGRSGVRALQRSAPGELQRPRHDGADIGTYSAWCTATRCTVPGQHLLLAGITSPGPASTTAWPTSNPSHRIRG
jgi:hypothetical protein